MTEIDEKNAMTLIEFRGMQDRTEEVMNEIVKLKDHYK